MLIRIPSYPITINGNTTLNNAAIILAGQNTRATSPDKPPRAINPPISNVLAVRYPNTVCGLINPIPPVVCRRSIIFTNVEFPENNEYNPREPSNMESENKLP